MADDLDSILSRRGMPKYRENPFLNQTFLSTKRGVKTVKGVGAERMMVVSEESGEILGPAGFWQSEEVDKTQFIKLFVNGVKALKELSSAGTRVFELLYLEMQKNIGKDKLHLSFQAIDQQINELSERTFYRGMQELVAKSFIAESLAPGVYFVNPDFIWNGDRLSFVRSFSIKATAETKKIIKDMRTRELPFDEPVPLQATDANAKEKKKTAESRAPAAKRGGAKKPTSPNKVSRAAK